MNEFKNMSSINYWAWRAVWHAVEPDWKTVFERQFLNMASDAGIVFG